MDATAQAEAVRSGEISSVELVQDAVGRAERLNPGLNAIIHPRYEQALKDAQAGPTGPLGGVPIVMKDLDGADAGEPYHGGIRALAEANHTPARSSWLNERLRAAGAISLGRTNVPELGLLPSTEPALYGPSRNPWDLTRSPAGSSGGSAAAVSAGIVAVGHAGDGGGSIRVPASVCGLVGLKPGRGRITMGPEVGEAWGGAVSRLAVTRTVRDTALVLDVLAGPGCGDPYGPCEPAPASYSSTVADGVSRPLRIAWTVQAPDPAVEVDGEVAEAVQATANVLVELGHEVDNRDPDGWGDADQIALLSGQFVQALGVWAAAELDRLAVEAGIEIGPDGIEPGTAAIAELGRAVTGLQYYEAVTTFHRIGREMGAWWDELGLDLLVTPTVPEQPWELGQFSTTAAEPLNGVLRAAPLVAFVVPFNITGQPAISLPLGWSEAGLPLGVQVVARPGREDLLLALASQLEQAMPWHERRPTIGS